MITPEEIAKAAEHALYLQNKFSYKDALTYLDHNFDQGAPGHYFASDYAKVKAAWADLIDPNSAYGEKGRLISVQRENAQ